jgi:hypothetical protein
MYKFRLLIAALAVGGIVITGCTNSSSPLPTHDGGGLADGSKENDAHADTGADGGGDCAFANFVIGLIKNDTTGTATPSTDLGASLQDSQEQSCFGSLF